MMIPANKKVEDLQPYLQYKYKQLEAECEKEGIHLLLIETKRIQERQTELYKQDPKANPPLVGPHGSGCAFDAAPLTNGKLDWKNTALFKKMGAIGKKLGLEWGGDYKSVDCPHFQWVGGLTDAQLRAGKLPKFPEIPKEGGFELMKYELQPLYLKCELLEAEVPCRVEPSKKAGTNGTLMIVKGHTPNIYAKVESEGINWYLVNPITEQWVEASKIRMK